MRALELLVPEGRQKNPVTAEAEPEDEDDGEEEVTKTSAGPNRAGKSIGRKRAAVGQASVAPSRGKTIGRGPAGSAKKDSAPAVPTSLLTRLQVRERIKRRLKNEETAAALAQWARRNQNPVT